MHEVLQNRERLKSSRFINARFFSSHQPRHDKSWRGNNPLWLQNSVDECPKSSATASGRCIVVGRELEPGSHRR